MANSKRQYVSYEKEVNSVIDKCKIVYLSSPVRN